MSAEPPDAWWSASLAEKYGQPSYGFLWRHTATRFVFDTPVGQRSSLPDDAVPLGVIEDPKHRGPSYQLGYRDGFNACRAGVPNPTEENNRG